MPFIKYTEEGRSFAARASISESGMLSFSDGARLRFKMDAFTHVILYYDAETQRIGVQLTNEEKAEGARKLRKRTKGAEVSIRTFLDFFDIAVSVTTLYTVEKDEQEDMIVVDRNKGRHRVSRTSLLITAQDAEF